MKRNYPVIKVKQPIGVFYISSIPAVTTQHPYGHE